MSVNISSAIMQYATGLVVTIDTGKFGPRQIKSFERALDSGLIKGGGVPDLVAKKARLQAGLPVVHMGHNLQWNNIPADHNAFYEWLMCIVGEQVLSHAPRTDGFKDYDAERIATNLELAKSRAPSGYMWVNSDVHSRTTFKGITLPAWGGDVPTLISLDVSNSGNIYWSQE